jgi:hypothetical protein
VHADEDFKRVTSGHNAFLVHPPHRDETRRNLAPAAIGAGVGRKSQVKALQDCDIAQEQQRISIRVGTTLVHGVDEPEDVYDFAERLCMRMRVNKEEDSNASQTQTPTFPHCTWNTLLECVIEKRLTVQERVPEMQIDNTSTPPDQYHYCVCRPR